jgi:hypothetical protein
VTDYCRDETDAGDFCDPLCVTGRDWVIFEHVCCCARPLDVGGDGDAFADLAFALSWNADRHRHPLFPCVDLLSAQRLVRTMLASCHAALAFLSVSDPRNTLDLRSATERFHYDPRPTAAAAAAVERRLDATTRKALLERKQQQQAQKWLLQSLHWQRRYSRHPCPILQSHLPPPISLLAQTPCPASIPRIAFSHLLALLLL